VQIQEDEHFITNWRSIIRRVTSNFFSKARINTKNVRKPPDTACCDRGYWSPENKEYAGEGGVKNVHPKKGKLNEQEKEFQSTVRFKKGQRFRAGGEAKISLLKRQYKLDRC